MKTRMDRFFDFGGKPLDWIGSLHNRYHNGVSKHVRFWLQPAEFVVALCIVLLALLWSLPFMAISKVTDAYEDYE